MLNGTSHVIIHAGTNNLPSESADSCVRKIQKLALKTRKKFQSSKIGISSLTHRDDINVTGKLLAVNVYNNHKKSLTNAKHAKETELSKYAGTCNRIKWSIIKRVPAYTAVKDHVTYAWKKRF